MGDIPKEIWYVIAGKIVVGTLFYNGIFWSTAENVADSGVAVIDAGKTMCEVKDTVLTELLDIAYDDVSEQAKKILDKFKSGEELTECDYLELYNSLDHRHVKNWTFDAACNAIVCSGI